MHLHTIFYFPKKLNKEKSKGYFAFIKKNAFEATLSNKNVFGR